MSKIETIRREDFDNELAWLAGFFDGEGNVNIMFSGSGRHDSNGIEWQVFHLGVVFLNTHADGIEKTTNILHQLGVKYKVHLRNVGHEKWRICAVVVVAGQKCSYKTLCAMIPHLSVKKQIALQAIYAYEYRMTLTRAGNNQYVKKENLVRIQDDPILNFMVKRGREIIQARPDLLKFSRIASQPFIDKKPSTTTRIAALTADDVRKILAASSK